MKILKASKIVLLYLIMISLGVPVYAQEGKLDSPGEPSAEGVTLTDIMNRISSGTAAGGHTLHPTAPPGATMFTLEEIYNALPAGSGTTAAEAAVLEGVTFIKRSGGQLIFSTGTMAIATWRIELDRFSDHGNGTVTDNATGLMWTKNADHGSMTWYDARDYIDRMNSGDEENFGFTDWRLPAVNKECDPGYPCPIIGAGMHPVELEAVGRPDADLGEVWDIEILQAVFDNVRSGNYWSSTTEAGNAEYAWSVDLGYGGYVKYGGGKAGTIYVWPVRGGQ